MNYHIFFGILATLIALVSYIPYFRNIFRGKTKPHAFSWLIWGIVTGIAFFAQILNNGGPGAWVTGFTTFICGAIFILALFKGYRKIAILDWICLILALIAIVIWIVTKNPLLSVILATLIDLIAFIPTVRKSYIEPYSETLFMYSLNGFKFVIAFLALEQISIVTSLYPLSWIILNWIFVIVILQRRKIIKAK